MYYDIQLHTTFFLSAQHAHSNEIFAAIAQNILNDLIDEVHTLHEIEPGAHNPRSPGVAGLTGPAAPVGMLYRTLYDVRSDVEDAVHSLHRPPAPLTAAMRLRRSLSLRQAFVRRALPQRVYSV